MMLQGLEVNLLELLLRIFGGMAEFLRSNLHCTSLITKHRIKKVAT